MALEYVANRKLEILNDLAKLEKDIEILQNNIKESKELLESIETEDQMDKFDDEFDIEKGLSIIELFG